MWTERQRAVALESIFRARNWDFNWNRNPLTPKDIKYNYIVLVGLFSCCCCFFGVPNEMQSFVWSVILLAMINTAQLKSCLIAISKYYFTAMDFCAAAVTTTPTKKRTRYFKLEKCNPFFFFDEMKAKINDVNDTCDCGCGTEAKRDGKKEWKSCFLWKMNVLWKKSILLESE